MSPARHNLKVGMSQQWGKYPRYNNANGDLYQTYNNGVPTQVTVLNTPLRVEETLDANFGVYAQDTWSMNKLTLNYGLRFDLNKQTIKGQDAMIGRFANVPAYEDISFPTWKDFSPRVSAVYDIAGNGKTAVRAGFNKFVTAQTTGFAQLYNPTALTTQVLPWTDVNGDDMAQGERGCAYLSAGCEINFANLPSSFGIRSLAQFDPDIKRPVLDGRSTSASRVKLFAGFSVAAEYYRIGFKNLTVRQNSLLNADSYNRFEVVSPLDGSVIPAWVLKPEFSNRVANIDSTSDDMKRNYNGLDINFNARMARGVRAFGGFNLERTINDVCVSAASDPNRSLYCNQADSDIPWQKQFKAHRGLPDQVGRAGQRFVAEPERLPCRQRGAGLRRLHRRHRLRPSERPGDLLAGDVDDPLCGELHGSVHARRSGPAAARGQRPCQPPGAARGAGDRVHPAHQPGGLLGKQAVQRSARST